MSKYDEVISKVFELRHTPDSRRVRFNRDDLINAHDEIGLKRTSNIGDIPYSYRFRKQLPIEIRNAAPAGSEWIITGVGSAEYEFRLARPGKVEPSTGHMSLKIPEATPEIVRRYAPGTDEQALLTRVRYNRLVDLFLGLTCYSIQNHLRTTVDGIGQIEVDEVYLGINNRSAHFVVPCQAKSPGDRFGIVQVMQDMAFCAERYPQAICRPIALQFLSADDVSILELTVREDDDVFVMGIVDEKHYRLVENKALTDAEIAEVTSRER